MSQEFEMLDEIAFRCEIGGSDHQEKLSDFLLENDDQGDQTDVHKASDHAADHFHLQQFGKLPKGPDHDDAYENIDGHRAFDQFVYIIQQYGHQNDIDDIGDLEFKKVEEIQRPCFCKSKKNRVSVPDHVAEADWHVNEHIP